MVNAMEEKNKKSRSFVIAVCVIVLLIAAGLGYLGRMWYVKHTSEKQSTGLETFYNTTALTQEQTPLVSNPIDFKTLKKTNSDLYAWIKVPGTKVNYPIAQSPTDDFFYLHHDYKKNYLFEGTLYTELCNSKDFKDPITLIYGHDMYSDDGPMFSTLHRFENQQFFNKHGKFYIYTAGHIFTYKVFSVFRYDDRHIMNSFDFTRDEVLDEFQKMLLNPRAIEKYVRDDTTLNKDSKVVILSTCCENDKSARLLVSGVLVKDERTK